MTAHDPVLTPDLPSRILVPPVRHSPARRQRLKATLQRQRLSGREPGLALITMQLVLLALTARAFRLETAGFYSIVMPLTVVGFVVHALLPQRHRLPFFVFLSVLTSAALFGAVSTVWLILVGAVLVAVCHLPLHIGIRASLLAGAVAGLGTLRLLPESAPWPAAVWPILGSMFMLRLIVYVHHLRHRREPIRFMRTAAYFFMLPNLCFPLFPVIDYATFERTYYDAEARTIYQRGIRWMLRGFVHLLCYRLVYQLMAIAPADAASGVDVVRFLAANFLLYLRVSGQFHLIVGMLHLFGFRLPETHRFFFLAASFTDFWRRINIYWKDFVQNVVFMPAYRTLRSLGRPHFGRYTDRTALIAATLFVFIATWLLHAYQFFWIRGEWQFTAPDALFWGTLGVLLALNAVYDAARPAQQPSWRTVRDLPVFAPRIILTLVTITLLWGLWSSRSLAEFGLLMAVLFDRNGITPVLLPLGVAVLAASWLFLPSPPQRTLARAETGGVPPARTAATLLGITVLLAAAAVPAGLAERGLGSYWYVLEAARSPRPNRVDAELLRRGYYEELTGDPMLAVRLWDVPLLGQDSLRWDPAKSLAPTGDFLLEELRPLVRTPINGVMGTTNRWGMRDHDYELAPAPGVYRVAVMGASYVWGAGVGDDDTFDNLLETRLNRESSGSEAIRYELLNFGTPGYGIPQMLLQLQTRAFTFQPHAVLFINHPTHGNDAVRHLARLAIRGTPFPEGYEPLQALVLRAGIRRGMSVEHAERLLKPNQDAIVSWLLGRLVEECRVRGVPVVWVLLSTPGYDGPPEYSSTLVRLARDAGLEVIDLSDVYDGYDVRTLQLAPWDIHPNTRGHELIAAALHERWAARALPREAPPVHVAPQ